MSPYTPQHVANFFLEKSEESGIPLTQLKLIKLVYIAYGWYLALTGRPLFDEAVQAWKHGPVIPSLYHEFKSFGRRPISERATCLDYESFEFSTPSIPDTDVETIQILNMVWNAYKKYSASALVRKTHEEGTPWALSYKEGEYEVEIPQALIKDHFKKKINDYIRAARSAA